MSDEYPQDTDAERWPIAPWPGNYEPPSDQPTKEEGDDE